MQQDIGAPGELLRRRGLLRVEVWVGIDGVLDRTVAVPDRPPAGPELGARERVVVGRACSGGGRWMSVWLPERLAERAARPGAPGQKYERAYTQ